MTNHRIQLAAKHFNIQAPEDWQQIRPHWIRAVTGVGQQTLDQIRLNLAARGLTLLDDATPDFWQRNLRTAKIGDQISVSDTAVSVDFAILIDSQEKQPWTFQGMLVEDNRPLIVPIKWQSLGPSHGDYSLAGTEHWCHVERKSVEDAIGTFLSHGERGDRWKATLEYLAEIPHGSVVIEGSIGTCLNAIKPRGKRSQRALVREFRGSLQSWARNYCIPFWFADSRLYAERWAFGELQRAWREYCEEKSVTSVNSQDQLVKSLL